MSKFLRCEDIEKRYGERAGATIALNGVDLSIRESEIVSIVGPSGSGKSTLLNIMSGLDVPSSGHVFYQDRDINRLAAKERSRLRLREMGFVFQFFNLIPNLTAYDNAILPAILDRKTDKANLVDDLIEAVGLSEKKDYLPCELSGGEQQRIAIIRALVNSPKVIFADEPTGNLDSRTGRQVLDLLIDQAQGHGQTLIYVTHDTVLAGLADRCVEIKDGEILRETSNTSRLS